jgi:hypothetical protein
VRKNAQGIEHVVGAICDALLSWMIGAGNRALGNQLHAERGKPKQRQS